MPRKPRPPPAPPQPARPSSTRRDDRPLAPLQPAAERIGESPGNLRAREEAFKKRRRGGPA